MAAPQACYKLNHYTWSLKVPRKIGTSTFLWSHVTCSKVLWRVQVDLCVLNQRVPPSGPLSVPDFFPSTPPTPRTRLRREAARRPCPHPRSPPHGLGVRSKCWANAWPQEGARRLRVSTEAACPTLQLAGLRHRRYMVCVYTPRAPVVLNLRFGGTGVGARRVQIPEEVLGALGY